MQIENDLAARAFRKYVGAKRRAERSATDVLSGMFIFSGIVFWAVAFWQLLSPPSLLSLATIQALVLAFVTSVAAPLLWSALVPSTPAGQLLQRTQWATIGYAVSTAAAIYLSYVEYWLLASWMVSQPGLAENGFSPLLAMATLIAFILIPALGWVRVPFHTMLDQIQQAHEVRKLELMQRAELAEIKNRVIWAETKALATFTNLLPQEQAFVLETIEAMFGRITDRQHEVARLTGVQADLESQYAMLPDQEIVDRLHQLQDELGRMKVRVHRPEPEPIDVTGSAAREREARQDAIPAEMAPVPSRPVPSPAPQRPAAPRSAPQRYADDYAAARKGLREWPAWTVATLAQILDMKERTARDRVNAWMAEGVVAPCGDKGRFNFTESEG